MKHRLQFFPEGRQPVFQQGAEGKREILVTSELLGKIGKVEVLQQGDELSGPVLIVQVLPALFGNRRHRGELRGHHRMQDRQFIIHRVRNVRDGFPNLDLVLFGRGIPSLLDRVGVLVHQFLKAREMVADVGADRKEPLGAERCIQELPEGRTQLEGVADIRGKQANLPQ